MKLIFLTILFYLISLNSISAQGGTWTWISGSSIPNSAGVYGTQGVPSIANRPPSDYEYIEWHDNANNLWVYGGTYTNHADLWRFNPSTLEWTWIKGNGTTGQPPIYGTQGVPDPLNTPGERSLAAVTWVDINGNFWLFGGVCGAGFKNDLWKLDVSTYEWTWVSGTVNGNVPGNHGVQGVPSTLNYPGSRTEAACSWTDSLNNLWMFAGLGYDGTGSYGNLGDLWKFNISTNEWTWMKGSSAANSAVVYGAKGVSNATNDPGSRFCYGKLKDKQDNLWVLGGFSVDDLNDVWKYNPAVNEWTWMSGTNQLNSPGNYTPLCVADTGAYPAGRRENRASITDNCGRFWVFGGFQDGTGMISDLWMFNPVDLTWKLVHGSGVLNLPGNFGTLGVPAATNIPTSRCGANAWWGTDNKFYLYGGAVNHFIDITGDMWVFDPDTNCIPLCANSPAMPVALFTAPNTICPGTCTDFINNSTNGVSYQWLFPGGVPSSSTDISPSGICYNSSGTYGVTLIATNSIGSDTLLLNNYITVHPFPPPQGILQNGDTLFANTGATSYQWYFNGTIINGATNYFHVATQSGNYNVVATDENDCEVEAAILNVTASLQLIAGSWQLGIFPNPVLNLLTIRGVSITTASDISVYNVLGEKIGVRLLTSNYNETTLDVNTLSPGTYLLEIVSGNEVVRNKFLKH